MIFVRLHPWKCARLIANCMTCVPTSLVVFKQGGNEASFKALYSPVSLLMIATSVLKMPDINLLPAVRR